MPAPTPPSSGATDLELELEKPLAPDRRIDLTGLTCPAPLLRSRFALERLRFGSILLIVATERDLARSLPRLARLHGARLLRARSRGGRLEFLLSKSGSRSPDS